MFFDASIPRRGSGRDQQGWKSAKLGFAWNAKRATNDKLARTVSHRRRGAVIRLPGDFVIQIGRRGPRWPWKNRHWMPKRLAEPSRRNLSIHVRQSRTPGSCVAGCVWKSRSLTSKKALPRIARFPLNSDPEISRLSSRSPWIRALRRLAAPLILLVITGEVVDFTTCAGNWLRTITSDQINNSSLSFRTRRHDVTG